MEIIRKRFFFSGRVQGVGFRYRAMRHATGLGLSGFVMNLDDGRVLMEAQGESEKIDMLLAAMFNERYIDIKKVKSDTIPIKDDNSFRYGG